MQLSIVIPTLNEATEIAGAIETIRRCTVGAPPEVLVLDSGSGDRTVEIARRCGVRVVVDPSLLSRAAACNAAAAQTTGDTLLFLHADSRVPVGYDEIIRTALAPVSVAGGAFEFALAGPEWRLRVVEGINRLRYRVRARYFGDQGIFVRRQVFDLVGGFPPLAILEDAYFCARAGKLGVMGLVDTPMLTSPRRFYRGGILTTLALDIIIVMADLAGLDPERFAGRYRQDNLRRGDNGRGNTTWSGAGDKALAQRTRRMPWSVN